MALQKEIIFKGITIPEAYHKITRFIGVDVDGLDAKSWSVELMVTKYKDATKEYALNATYYTVSIESEDDLTYKKYYSKLKELEDFSDAEDILEVEKVNK